MRKITILGLMLCLILSNFSFAQNSLSERINNLKTQKNNTVEVKQKLTPPSSGILDKLKNKNQKTETTTETIVENGVTTKKETIKKVSEEVNELGTGEIGSFFKDDWLNNEIIGILDQWTKKKIEEYEEYIKLQEADKLKMEADKRNRIDEIKKNVDYVKGIIETQEGIYVGLLYIPKDTALYYIKYDGMVYLLPYYEYAINYDEELSDKNKILDEKDRMIDQLKADSTNNIITINKPEDFQKIKDNFLIYTYEDFISKTMIETNQGKNFQLFDSLIVNQALKEIGLTYRYPEWTFLFFIENEEDTNGLYKKRWDNATIKIYNSEANMLATGISHIENNSKRNRDMKNFKEFSIPLKIKKETKNIIIKKQNMWIEDLILIIGNFIILAGIIYFSIKKVLNIYKNY